MRQRKYFYLCTDLGKGQWVNDEGYLVDPILWAEHIGDKWWPYTRREARLKKLGSILQFDRQTLKFIKIVK